ncbi:homeobox protein cut-like 1 [Ylistrum balloti]|uniref:homeobox protein cut-like 1 n=1 Tax=Ylistrum balloti TaxID=509963 RepID=UPI0029059E0E|nr:homeobox protein cut-like 1 [Ylistrum balloti]
MAAGVQSMCQYWKDFDLQELQKQLDTTATELANRQDESDASRKRLVEQSRDFKKNTPEELRKLVAPLLKSFQAEVDSLSKRSKAAEGAFLSVYKKIIDLPDPVSVLEYASQLQKKAHRVSDLEIENKQLRETLEEYNHEFAEVKNQEVTIKQLKERLRDCEEKIEATAETRTKEKERELQRSFADKERQLQESQLSVARKLGEAEQKVSTLHASLEHVQQELFEVKSKYDETTSAKSDEMEMVMADLERANERAAATERQVEQLQQQLTKAVAQDQTGTAESVASPNVEQAMDILQRSSLEVELAAKEKEIAQLVDDVQRLQASLNKLRESSANQVSKLEEELTLKNEAFRVLEEKMRSQGDYEEVKRELVVLKSIEFSQSAEETGDKSKSLEMLLLEKNKSLQSENTTVKLAKSEISGDSTPALSENAEAFASMLGEEIAATYQQQQQREQQQREQSQQHQDVSRISTPSTPSSGSGGGAESEKSSPKRTFERVPSIPSSDVSQIPPPSPQFFPFGNGPLISNYVGLGGVVKSEPNNSQGLDTSLVAKTIRELLSIHNIGQRLFAKHVLGLSQGTVSELLSKPKSWDKLTEKGRESYRKMYQWATDDRNILSLKAISPKKTNKAATAAVTAVTSGNEGISSSMFNSLLPVLFTGSQHLVPSVQHDDSHTEERIAQILNDAQKAMHMKKAMEQHQVASAMASSIYQQEMTRLAQVSDHQVALRSPNSVSSSNHGHQTSHSRKYSMDGERHRDNVENSVSSKEMVERIYRQELLKLAKAAESAGNLAASSMYQQELARLAVNAQKEDQEPGEIRRSHSSPENPTVKTEPPDSTSDDLGSQFNGFQSNGPIDLSKHSNSAPTTPTSGSSDKSPSDPIHHAGSAFFLVRPKMNGHENGYDKPRFGSYAPAECISPLQRMQSIANSVMSRPHVGVSSNKPLRAVLPPITQEQFDKYGNIGTEELVKQVKETLSQYSISQRLFGESVLGLSQGSVSDLLARPKPWHMLTQKGREPFIRMQIFLEDTEAIPKLVASQYHIPPEKLMRSAGNRLPGEQMSPPEKSTPVAVASTQVPPDHPLHHLRQQILPPHSTPAQILGQHYNWASFSYPSSMLEVVAMTSEIDTLELTSRVKDVLQFHNLGQKLFGEAVLGLSQGSVSELLSKPKPWHMLSIKGREPFIKMHLWLSDPHNVERLKHYQNEIKAQRRRRSSSVDDRSYDSPSAPKRPRVFFNEDQKEKLRMAYNQDPYPNQSTIEGLANELNVGVKTVINWFHNHRMRAKQQQHAGNTAGPAPGSNFSDFSGNIVKSEPTDDNSDQSDISSMSGDGNQFQQSFQGNEGSSQWLFPQFEPVNTQRSGAENSEGQNEEEVENDRISGEASPLSSKASSLVEEGKDDNGGSGDDTQFKQAALQALPQVGVNKRKRSNPQYVSEGRQLDKTKTPTTTGGYTCLQSSVSRDEGVEVSEGEETEEDLEKENEDVNGSSGVKPRYERCTKIDKLQKSIESPDEDWDEFDRSASIEKLQSNLQHSPGGGWEF